MGKVKYYFTIKTADQMYAGTDSNIFVVLYGEYGQTHEERLNGHISGNAFERNNTDTCSIALEDVGNIYQLALRSDMAYAGADWRLSYIEVQRDGNSYTTRFNINEEINDKSTKFYQSADIVHNVDTYTTTVKPYKEYVVTVPGNGSYKYSHTETITKSSVYRNSTTKQSTTEFNTELQKKSQYSASLPLFEGLVNVSGVSENFLKFAFSQGFSSQVVNEVITTDAKEITTTVSLDLPNPLNINRYYLMKYQLVIINALVSTGDIAAKFDTEQSIEFCGATEIDEAQYNALSSSNSNIVDHVTQV